MVKECKKLFSAFLCSKKRNQKSRLITIDKNVAILLTELFFYFVNLAAASPWLRRSWSPNYSVLVTLAVLGVGEGNGIGIFPSIF
jgi:hypothetical protein